MINKGELFRTSAGGTFRLLALDKGDPTVAHVFGMDEEQALPQQWKLDALKEGLRSGEYERLPYKLLPVTVARVKSADGEDDRSASEKAADRRMELIAALVNNPDIYWRSDRGKLVENRAKEMDVSKQTIMASLRLWWRGGMTRDALVANFSRCGIQVQPGKVGAVRGRKTTRRKYKKFAMSDDDKANIRKTGLRLYRRKKTATEVAIYTAIVARHYTYVDANGKAVPKPLGERPTQAQVRHELGKHVTLEVKLRRKHGNDTFENDFQPKTGSSRIHADSVGRYYEIDSTIVDVWIVAKDDHATVIGKATLYLVVDMFSNLIAGFHLSLDKPSWSGAMEAMLTVASDKRALCARWDFDYDPLDWPAHGVWPMFWVADRGSDFLCKASDNAVEGIEGGFVNVPRRKAPRKGRVECSFKLIHVPLKDHVGGYTPPADIGKRQTDDLKDEATRTLKGLGNEILHSIRKHNHRVHKGMKLPARDVYKHLQPIPVQVWQRDYEERAGMLSSFDEDYLRFKLLPQDEATVTTRGILFDGRLYEPEGRAGQGLLMQAVKGVFKTPVSHERRLVDAIYIHDPKNPANWTTAHLSGNSASYLGLSAAEFESIEGVRITLDDLADEHNLTLNVRHYLGAEEREKVAKDATQKALHKAAGRSRTYGGKQAREVEVTQEHGRTKVMASTAAPSAPAPRPSSPVPAPRQQPASVMQQAASNSPTAPTAANTALLALLKMRNKP